MLGGLTLSAAADTAASETKAETKKETAGKSSGVSKSEAQFLDRLMMVESGGRQYAKNPRSSALGPYQFIRSTFYDVVSRNFPELTADKSYAEIQLLRVDMKVARQAALVYTRENARYLDVRGVKPEPGYLRLAFLLGPGGAHKVISAKPETLLQDLLDPAALRANPFMQAMTAKQLIERAKREAAGLEPLPVPAGARAASAHPEIKVRCNLGLASCRKWLALAKKRLTRKKARQAAARRASQ